MNAQLIGPILFTARMHTTDEALSEGAIDAVVEDAGALVSARTLASEIAVNGQAAIRAAKRAIDEGQGLPTPAALEIERRAYESIIPTEDRREALKAFAEKRSPVYRGR